MKTVEITHHIYDDVLTIPKEDQQRIYDYADSKSLKVTGDMSIAHITVYYAIMDALRKKCHVKLIPEKETYYYICGDIVKDKWHILEDSRTNLISLFQNIFGHNNIFKEKTLKLMIDNIYTIQPEAVSVFEQANPHFGDIVILNHKTYTCINYGILHFFENNSEVHALINHNMLLNKTNTTPQEIRKIIYRKSKYNFKIIANETEK